MRELPDNARLKAPDRVEPRVGLAAMACGQSGEADARQVGDGIGRANVGLGLDADASGSPPRTRQRWWGPLTGPFVMLETNRQLGGLCTPALAGPAVTRRAAVAGHAITPRPRLLFVSCHLPWPPTSGGRRRELELIKRIAPRFEVHLLVVSKTPQQDLANAHLLRRWCGSVEVFGTSPHPVDAADLQQPAQVLRHRCPGAADRVRELLATGMVDLVHVEGFYLMQHLPARIPLPLLLVEQNVEYELERQRAALGEGTGAPMLTEAVERHAWKRATRVAAVTPEDRLIMQRAVPDRDVLLVPDGADHVPQLRVLRHDDPRISRPHGPLLMLLANFAYGPNVDAAEYLCREIFPSIRHHHADAALWLVGNAPPPEVRALGSEAVLITGRVPDVLPYLDAADVVVCPLRIGGGIKVKTIEALRRGKAIVSTAVGAQGLPLAARGALEIADDPAAFAERVISLLACADRRAELETNAARAAHLLPSWDDAARALAEIYDGLLEREVATPMAAGARR